MKVSVIVPVYNVYPYLDKCLNSLVGQTLKDIEIIVVNDGSSDNSLEIVNKYKKYCSNIKVFSKDNSGLSDTRNFGIKHATGEYLAFVDGDDYVNSEMYEKMYEKAKTGDYDIVTSDINYVYPDKEEKLITDPRKDTSKIKKLFIAFYPTVCTKIFKRELFTNNHLEFKSGVWYEDVEFMYRLLPYIKKVGKVDEAFYNYVQREKSITSTISPKVYDYVNNFNGLVEYYKNYNYYEKYYKELEYAYVRYVYATFIKTSLGYQYNEYLKAVEFAIKNVKKQFPKYRKNIYFYRSFKGLYLVLFNKTLAKLLYRMRGSKNEKK